MEPKLNMTQRKLKVQFASSLHRGMANLSQGETYRGFVLGVRYNRMNYLDHKALFDFGLYLPRTKRCGTFTINTRGMKKLVDGEYHHATGMNCRAKWRKVKNILTVARLMGARLVQPHAVTPPLSATSSHHTDVVQRKESIDSETETKQLAPKHKKMTWPAIQPKTKAKRFQVSQHTSNDSLEVCDAVPPSNPRSAYHKRAGYANIDVRLRGKSLVPSHAAGTVKIVLPKLAFDRHDSIWEKTAKPGDMGAWEWEKERENKRKADCKLPPLHRKSLVSWQPMDKQLSVVMTEGVSSDSVQGTVA